MAVLAAGALLPLLAAGLLVALLALAYKQLSGYLRKWAMMQPIPAVCRTYPFVGNALELKTDAIEFFKQIQGYTDVFRDAPLVKLWLGTVPFVILYHAETVEPIVSNPAHMDKSDVYSFLHPWLGTGLLTSTGAKWRERRKMLTPTFHFSILQDFLEVMNEQAQVLVDKLASRAGAGPFNCFNCVTLCALDIICETAMGKKVYAQSNSESEYVQSVYKMSDIISRRQRAPWFWPDLTYKYFGEGKLHDSTLKTLHSFTLEVIRERAQSLKPEDESGGRKRRAFLDMLLQTKDQDGNAMSHQDIQEEVDTFMFRGHDTTAASMNWALHLLGSHPDVCRKVQRELQEVFGESERVASMEDLKQLKYLECVIKEALRIFPSVPFFARSIRQDTKINGFTIPSGTNAVVLPFALHRDPRYFPDPEEFRPERFLPENSTGRPPYAYIPFSAGLRNCIGQRFAIMEEKVVLSSILRKFHVKAHQSREQLIPTGGLILRPESGIWIQLEKRA
ncbi:cytochrome P450 4V2-like [Corythoichthys intestinalis]|uniref:cytochrome P450 4V2-like n=1 Tax=Corythoichthys intestinalis TaxID=161448 RepID=UPI0025A671FB|nr:cytochrome P450 4V2-like [Corythoichthys intestinalis]XP_061792259.1 cytochrome P450 4V2-like [Nerophis lumbriciformis]